MGVAAENLEQNEHFLSPKPSVFLVANDANIKRWVGLPAVPFGVRKSYAFPNGQKQPRGSAAIRARNKGEPCEAAELLRTPNGKP